jgi:hypothetical protein
MMVLHVVDRDYPVLALELPPNSRRYRKTVYAKLADLLELPYDIQG